MGYPRFREAKSNQQRGNPHKEIMKAMLNSNKRYSVSMLHQLDSRAVAGVEPRRSVIRPVRGLMVAVIT